MDGSALNLFLRAAHLLGVIFWVGGAATAALVVVFASPEGREPAAAAARKTLLWVATPGMLVAWAAGLAVLLPSFGSYYLHEGWMHGKLTVALVVTGLTGVLTGRLRRAAGGSDAKPGLVRALGLALLVLAAVVVFLVKLGPSGGG